MMQQRSSEIIKTLMVLGLLALGVLGLQSIRILVQGNVCNHSPVDIWVTVSEAGLQKVQQLAPGQCTQRWTQDAEAIWGNDCSTDPCQHQAWKVSAGHFDVVENKLSPAGTVLRIDGWGAGSRWRVSDEWTKPDLASINYSLVK